MRVDSSPTVLFSEFRLGDPCAIETWHGVSRLTATPQTAAPPPQWLGTSHLGFAGWTHRVRLRSRLRRGAGWVCAQGSAAKCPAARQSDRRGKARVTFGDKNRMSRDFAQGAVAWAVLGHDAFQRNKKLSG